MGKPLAALSSLLGYGTKTETTVVVVNEDDILRSPRRPALIRSDASDISELDASAAESAQRARAQAEQARIDEQIRQGSVANLYSTRMCKVAPLAWSAYRRGSVDSSGVGSPTLKTPVLITPQASREFEYDEPVRHSPPSPHADSDSNGSSEADLRGLGFKAPPPGFGARYTARYGEPPLRPPPVDAGIAQMLFNVEAREFGTSPSPQSARFSDTDSDGTERGRSRRLSPITASDEVVYKSIGLAGLGTGSAARRKRRARVVTPRTP